MIRYALPRSQIVTLRVFNVLSQKVTTLADSRQSDGYHEVASLAHGLASGVYFYVIRSKHADLTRKISLLNKEQGIQ